MRGLCSQKPCGAGLLWSTHRAVSPQRVGNRQGGILLSKKMPLWGLALPPTGSLGAFFPTHTCFGLNFSLSTVPNSGTLLQFSNKLQCPHLQTGMAFSPLHDCCQDQTSHHTSTPGTHCGGDSPSSTLFLFCSQPVSRHQQI